MQDDADSGDDGRDGGGSAGGGGRSRPNVRPDTQAERGERERRLAEQLRANLKKRKRQQRARRTGGQGDDAPPGDGPAPEDAG